MSHESVLFLETLDFYEKLLGQNISSKQYTFDGANLSLKKILKYDLIVYTIYLSPSYSLIINKCSENNVDTLLLFDGIVEFTNFTENKLAKKLSLNNYHPILSSNIAVIGDRAKGYFQELGIKAHCFMPYRLNNLDKDIKLPSNDTFLITSANTAYYNEDEYKKVLSIYKQIIQISFEKKFRVIFRIFDNRLIEDLCIPSKKNYISGSFEEVLALVDFVITTPSSISLTAMKHNRLVAHLIYRDCPEFFQASWNIFPTADVESIMRSMLSREYKRIAFQNNEVKRTFENEFDIGNLQPVLFTSDQKKDFVVTQERNLLESKLVFNFEPIARKIYWKFSRNKIVKFIKSKIF